MITRTRAFRHAFLILLLSARSLAQKPADVDRITESLGTPNSQIFNINRISSWYRSNGNGNFPPSGAGDGMSFPRRTGSVIYEDGIMWGAKVFRDPAKTIPGPPGQFVRVGGNEYVQGNQAGRIVGFGSTAVASNPAEPAVRIYRIRRDWNAMTDEELRNDAGETNESTPSSVTSVEIEALKAQYAKDWMEWPVAYGAPYVERNGIPGYQPPPAFNYDPGVGPLFTAESLITQKHDEPGICGSDPNIPADQVLWTVYNDLNRSLTTALYGSEPIGLEVQITLWGYKRDDPLGNVMFKRVRLINKGGVDTSGTGQKGSFWIDSMYVAQWSDPDVGNLTDDLVGCDTVLSLAFAYNSSNNDLEYDNFALPPPAVGYDYFAGPAVAASPTDSAIFGLRYVSGKRNLPMTSFTYTSGGSNLSDPRPRNSGASQVYKMLRGYLPIAGPDSLYPFPPGTTPDKFPLSGDPVSGTGFLDGLGTSYSLLAGDRRFFLSSGPFSLAPGDTQEVVLAVLAALGADRLSSLAELKVIDQYAQAMLSSLFALPESPKFSVEVNYPSSATAVVEVKASEPKKATKSVSTTLKRHNGATVATVPLYDDGAHNDGAANDGVFAGSTTISRQQDALLLTGTVVFKSDITVQMARIADNITTAGIVRLKNPVVFFDNVNNDGVASPDEYIHFGFTVENSTSFSFPYFTLDAKLIAFGPSTRLTLPQLPASTQFTFSYDSSNTNTFLPLQIPAQFSGGSLRVPFLLTDSLYNRWLDTLSIPVVKPLQTRGSWQQTSGPYGGDIKSIARSSSGFLYAVSYPAGVYRSPDNGEHWSKIAGYEMYLTRGIVVAGDGSIIASSGSAIFRSTDDGTTWSKVHEGSYYSFRLLTMGPQGTIYLCLYDDFLRSTDNGLTWEQRTANGPNTIQSMTFNGANQILIGTPAGVFRSTDEGFTWSSLGLNGKNVLSLQVLQNGAIMLAGTDSALYRSSNGGSTWTAINLEPSATSVASLVISPSGVAYAGTGLGNVFRSIDGGITWLQVGSTIQGTVQFIMADGSGQLFAGTSQSLYRWTNLQQKWEEKSSGISGLTCYSFSTTAWSEVYASTNRGIFRSSDDGLSWNLVYPFTPATVGPTLWPVVAVKQNGAVFAGTPSGVFVSLDQGATWIPRGLAGTAIRSLAVTPRGDILAGGIESGKIYLSTDDGTTWSVVHTSVNATESIYSLASDTAGYFYASTSYGKFLVSSDNGSTWNQPNQIYLSALQILVTSDGSIYAATGGRAVARSTDRGSTWIFLFSRGFSGYQTRGVTTNSLGHIFAAASGYAFENQGVFRSTDNGTTWYKLNSGLGYSNSAMAYSVASTGNGYLLVGTNGEGIYRTIAPTTAMDLRFDFSLAQNYPNPFNAITTIQYSIAYRSSVKLKIYNLLGQEIATLFSGELDPGVYITQWNAGRFASGVYFCRIEAGNLVDTKKLLLLR